MMTKKQTNRMFYIDNLRVYLTILVILHHGTLAYGGNGGWGIRDTITDEISPILFTVFNALNQSYFMTAFFLLSGYFTPGSLERKGARSFIMDRIIRLGIPLLVYTTLVVNLNSLLISTYSAQVPFEFELRYDPGHLWFLQLLLIFPVMYIVYKKTRSDTGNTGAAAFPANRRIWGIIFVLSFLTYLVRLVFPVGQAILNIQPGHVVHYIFAFYLGIFAKRAGWFEKLSPSQGKRWGWTALITFLFLFVLMILGGALEGEENIAKFLGGFTWQAAAYSVWETIMMVAMITFLIYLFREKFNQAGNFLRTMGANAYTAYIVHQPLLYIINIIVLHIAIPSYAKFFVISLVGVPFTFWVSHLIRKLPYTRRVLG